MELDFVWLEHDEVAVHCNTKEKANEFIKKAHEAGYKGMEDQNCWYFYGENTCYEIDVGSTNDIYFCGIDHFKRERYEVIEYELDKQETPLPKLCELLGVGVNEEFTLVDTDEFWTYKIADDGKFYYKYKFSDWKLAPQLRTDILYNPSLIIKVKKYPDLTPDDKIFLKKMYDKFGDADVEVTSQSFRLYFFDSHPWAFPIDFFNGLETGMKFRLSELLEV